MRVFVSYCHRQGEWVWDRLVPCLKAGSAEVLIDRERFEAGKGVKGHMDATQDQADRHLLVFSDDYLKSSYCRHEMERAVRLDPNFEHGIVVPVLRADCTLPGKLKKPDPVLYADLRDDNQSEPWSLLLQQCEARLGTTAPEWLTTRDQIVWFLGRGQSVNLVVDGRVAWRPLLDHLVEAHFPALCVVNLEQPATASRRGLVTAILKGTGARPQVPAEPEDLAELQRVLEALPTAAQIALIHFDLAAHRPNYGVDLFAALRYLIMEDRKLVLLAESRSPFATLLPRNNPLSDIDIKTVQLQGRR